MPMPRVLMLYTGGTIGMQPSPQGYIPCAGLAERLAAHFALGDPYRLPAFDVIEMQPNIISPTNIARPMPLYSTGTPKSITERGCHRIRLQCRKGKTEGQ